MNKLNSSTAAPAKQPRITAINLVRLFVISLVIATHIASSNALYDSFFAGSIWMVSHVSRLLFVALTALVLMYNYGPSRPFSAKTFYLKRFTFVLLPYATWTLIYQLQDGITQGSVGEFVRVYLYNFITSNAMYHLYFLLITMQIYLLFPLIRWAYGKVQQWPKQIFLISLTLQLGITALLQYVPAPHGLEWYWAHPENFIWTHQFYVVCGILIATHITKFASLMRRHFRTVMYTALATTAIGFALYVLEFNLGAAPNVAAAVYQPFIVLTSIVYGCFAFALGFKWVEKGERFGAFFSNVAEDSFGVYLVHVLILVKLAEHFQPAANDFLTGTVILIIGLPVIYLASFAFSEIARRTPLSIFLTGRKRAPIRKPARIQPVTNF